MSKVALVIVYEGTEPSVLEKQAMLTAIAGSVDLDKSPEPDVYFLNGSELAAVAAGNVACRHDEFELQKASPYEQAITCIARACKDSIRSGLSTFAGDLAGRYIMACTHQNDPHLVKAVQLMAEDGAIDKIPLGVRRKYGIGSPEIKAIREMYLATCAGHIVI